MVKSGDLSLANQMFIRAVTCRSQRIKVHPGAVANPKGSNELVAQ